MKQSANVRVALAAALLAAACASTPDPVSTQATDATADKSLRVLGRDNDVRIEARVLSNEIRQAGTVLIAYEIENLRSEAIAFAPLDPTIAYEPSSRTLTVGLGSEIPVEEALPRLVRIGPGERKTFTTGARIAVPAGMSSRSGPRFLQLRFSYLDATEAFDSLIAGRGAAPADHDGLFRTWLDHLAAVVTNALPIRWGAPDRTFAGSASERSPVALP